MICRQIVAPKSILHAMPLLPGPPVNHSSSEFLVNVRSRVCASLSFGPALCCEPEAETTQREGKHHNSKGKACLRASCQPSTVVGCNGVGTVDARYIGRCWKRHVA